VVLQSPHDGLFRAAFESPRHAAQLLAGLLPGELTALVELGSLELQPGGGRGKNLEEFRADLLFRASIAGTPGFVCFLFEHQSTSDMGMPLRVLGYQLRTWERAWRENAGRPLAPIVPIVVSHDTRGWKAPRELIDLFPVRAREHPVLRSMIPNFRCFIDDLSELTDADLRARALAPFPTLVLLALRDARTPGQLLHELDLWADALTDVANAPDGQDALRQLFLYISTVADNLPLETLRSRVAKLCPAAEEAIMTIAEQLQARGLSQGLEQGLSQGRQQGLQQGLQQALLQTLEMQLTQKFGPLPDAVAARLRSADSPSLTRWLARVLSADSAEGVVEL
jgi:predicted transposase/invertase (TIGR01784 family)